MSPAHNIGARQDAVTLHRTDGKAREIVVLCRIHARHLGGLAADQRAAGLPAALGDARHHAAGRLHIELAAGEIVEKEQRLRALGEQIVDAHGDEIDADGGVQAGIDGDLELGADAVVGRHQDRVLEAGGLEIEQGAEAAEVGIRAAPPGRPRQRLDGLHQGIAGVDVDARVAIGDRRAVVPASWHGGLSACSQLSPNPPGKYWTPRRSGHSRPGRESVGSGVPPRWIERVGKAGAVSMHCDKRSHPAGGRGPACGPAHPRARARPTRCSPSPTIPSRRAPTTRSPPRRGRSPTASRPHSAPCSSASSRSRPIPASSGSPA